MFRFKVVVKPSIVKALEELYTLVYCNRGTEVTRSSLANDCVSALFFSIPRSEREWITSGIHHSNAGERRRASVKFYNDWRTREERLLWIQRAIARAVLYAP